MKEYIGIKASVGIAIGEAFIYNQKLLIPKFSISTQQVEYEVDRFYTALRKTKEEYQLLQQKLVIEMSKDDASFLDAHILMTEDQTFIEQVVETMRSNKKNLEWTIFQVIEELYKKFSRLDDEYFRDRAVDILDLGRKIMQILLSQKHISLAELKKDVIIIAPDLSVSDTASMNKRHVLGFVTELGGRTSHSAILARSLSIPAVLGIPKVSHNVTSGDIVIIDGLNGKVIVSPDEDTIEKYRVVQRKFEEKEREYLKLKDLPSVTLDKRHIVLKANMEIPAQELESILNFRAEGIGLYRSEFLYLSDTGRRLPNEHEQFMEYKNILKRFPKDFVTIRTLDLGGDKVLDGITNKEVNPNLGWRAIRFCLAKKDIFKTQLRALYRASVFGNLKIMLPMISNMQEVEKTLEIIEEVKAELAKEGKDFKNDVPVGIMVETPAAALISDKLGKIVDFFSIGSNDLIQYTLACDRGNEKVAYLYEPLHPAVLQLIKKTIDNGHTNNITVSICGEMGSEILSAVVLIGLGIDEISLNPGGILELKKVVRNIKYCEAAKLAEEILDYENHRDISERVKKWLKEHVDL